MEKEKEDERFVWYTFFEDVAEGLPQTSWWRKKRHQIRTKFGIFRFDKKNKTIELIKEKTDPHFFTATSYKMMCWATMKRCAEKNKYPEKTCFAT